MRISLRDAARQKKRREENKMPTSHWERLLGAVNFNINISLVSFFSHVNWYSSGVEYSRWPSLSVLILTVGDNQVDKCSCHYDKKTL
jgi:hypothetical protein